MKKTFLFLMAVISLTLMLCIVSSAASIDDLTFTFIKNNTEYEVSACNTSASGELVIPEIYNGFPVTSIGNSAFTSCMSLTSVTLPNSLTNIGLNAFFYCTGLTNITVPSSVVYVKSGAFSNCTSLRTVRFENSACHLGSMAFSECSSLYSVDLGNSVIDIGSSAFYECTLLDDIIIPDSVVSIGDQAFAYCTGLIDVSIGNGVETIGKMAFYNCSELTFLSLGKGVKTVGDKAFTYCSKLTALDFSDSLLSFGDSAFSHCTSLKTAVLGNSITKISSNSFKGCSSLGEIEFCEGIVTIESEAFRNCTSLKKIDIPYTVTEIKGDAFSGCTSLSEVKLKAGLINIWQSVFFDCTSLREITIPATVKVLGNMLFSNCKNLQSVYILSTNASIPKNAFNNLTNLFIFCYKDSTAYDYAISNNVSCSILDECPHLFVQNPIEAYLASEASCGTSDSYYYSCMYCGGKGSDTFEYGDVLQHSYSTLWTFDITPTCTSSGEKSHHCTACGDRADITFLPELGHSWGSDGICVLCGDTNYSDGLAFTLINDGKEYEVSGLGSCTDTDIVIPSVYNGKSVTRIADSAFYSCTELTSVTIPEGVTALGFASFVNCDKMSSIVIPSTVTSIGEQAFYMCSSLQSISLPEGITAIPRFAFTSCYSLSDIDFPDGLTSIGSYAFEWCRALTSIELPSTLEEISFYAFHGCAALLNIEIPENTKKISSYAFMGCRDLYSVSLPASLQSIGKDAFVECYNLKEVHISDISAWCNVNLESYYSNPLYYARALYADGILLKNLIIPEGVSEIKKYAFYNAISIKTVDLPNSLNTVGEEAFFGTYYPIIKDGGIHYIDNWVVDADASITSATVKDGTVGVASGAFSGSTSMASINLPSSIKTINYRAFSYCKNLKSVYITDMSAWCNIDFNSSNPLSNSADLYLNNTLVTNLIIPEDITTVKKYTFFGCNSISSVYIPYGTTAIENNAFEKCSNLKTVYLPDTITSLGDSAFYRCTSLNGVTIPGRLKEIGKYVFYCCYALESITFHENIEKIGYGAFTGCKGLTEIVIPNTVKTVDDYAFAECSNLVTVDIKPGTTSIGECAFFLCKALCDITIPNTVESIGRCAFSECMSLTSITIPDSVTEIGEDLFLDGPYPTVCCYESSAAHRYAVDNGLSYELITGYSEGLAYTLKSDGTYEVTGIGTFNAKTLIIPASYNEIPVTSIGNKAFSGCTSFNEIILNEGIVSIGSQAFYGTAIEELTLPSTLTTVGSWAFYQCTSLKSAELTSSLTNIGEHCFQGCTSLESVIIPEGITAITKRMFHTCSSLKNLTLPDSVTRIEADAFYKCTSLGTVSLNESIAVSEGAFSQTGVTLLIYDGSPAYAYAVKYSVKYEFKSKLGYTLSSDGKYYVLTSASVPQGAIVTVPAFYQGIPVKAIGAEAFKNSTGIAGVVIEEGIGEIMNSAFFGCSGLKSADIPFTVTNIGENAFYGCTSLESINIPSTVTEIPKYAFYNCTSLKSIALSDAVTEIDEGAFSVCTSLESISFSKNLTVIGSKAFRNCTSLVNVVIPNSVTSIKDRAFNGCTALETIKIGNNVAEMGVLAVINTANILCYEDSAAHNFAVTSKIPYTLIEPFGEKGTSLVLDSNIGIKVYFEIDDSMIDVSSLKLNAARVNSDYFGMTEPKYDGLYMMSGYASVAHGEDWLSSVLYDSDSSLYYVIFTVAPKDGDNITFSADVSYTLKNGTSKSLPITAILSVTDYIMTAKNEASEGNGAFTEALALIDSLENYVYYADNFFNEGSLASYKTTASFDSIESASRNGGDAHLTFDSTSLILDDTITLRHYFNTDDMRFVEDNYSSNAEFGTKGSLVYYDITDITAENIGTLQNLTVRNSMGEIVYTIDYSVANYIASTANSDNARLASLMNVLYDYYLAAKSYTR